MRKPGRTRTGQNRADLTLFSWVITAFPGSPRPFLALPYRQEVELAWDGEARRVCNRVLSVSAAHEGSRPLGRPSSTLVQFGVGLVVFGAASSLWISLPVLAVVGFAMMVQNAASNTVVQTMVDDHTRGRVMGFFAMAFMGTMPFGNLAAGALAHGVGAPATLMIGGGFCVLTGVAFWAILPKLRILVRPVYIARGILPPLPEGVGSAAGLLPCAQQ